MAPYDPIGSFKGVQHSFLVMAAASARLAGCAGLGGVAWLLACGGMARAEEMTFQALGSGDAAVIAATGQISDRTPVAFAAFLRDNARAKAPTVYLDSSGGTVLGSMQLGALLRQAGATAVVGKVGAGFLSGPSVDKGECYSACVYALMGGRRRVIPPESEVGIHRMFLAIEGQGGDVTQFASSGERSAATGIRASLMRYASRMGVSPELITSAEKTPSAFFHILTPDEIRKWHLGVPAL